jgi:hypothetical protein
LDDVDEDPPFPVGSSHICKLPAKFFLLLIHVDTPLGTVLDRVGMPPVEDLSDLESYSLAEAQTELAEANEKCHFHSFFLFPT